MNFSNKQGRELVCRCCGNNSLCDGFKLFACLLITTLAITIIPSIGCDYGDTRNPDWHRHHKKTIEETREEVNAGYLGAPFQCECGYSPAIAHPSFKDCVEHYKRKYEECCNK